jgi:endonuclease YncB( thermonuclease family)
VQLSKISRNSPESNINFDQLKATTRLLRKALLGAFFYFVTNASAAEVSTHVVAETPPTSCIQSSKFIEAKVAYVLSGDTFTLEDGRVVKLAGVEAPEYNRREPSYSENGAQQSKEYLTQLLPKNISVKLFFDNKKQDRYGHILASVSRSIDQLDLASEMLINGWVRQIVNPPNDTKWSCYQRLEKAAQSKNLGLWGYLRYWPRITKFVVKSDAGYLRLYGEVTSVKRSRRYLTLVLDDKIWLGLKISDLENFSEDIEFKYLHKKVDVRGWLYFSNDKLRIRIRHPQQINLYSDSAI